MRASARNGPPTGVNLWLNGRQIAQPERTTTPQLSLGRR
jgi:hypothetical protein